MKFFMLKHGPCRYLDCQKAEVDNVDHKKLLANDGLMLLAERVRDTTEKALVQKCIFKHLKVSYLYSECISAPPLFFWFSF